MPKRREFSTDPDSLVGRALWATPESELAALMATAPNAEPLTSREETLPLRELLADAIDDLDEEDRWVFDAVIVERRSLGSVAADLSKSKSEVHRIKDRALRHLREALEQHPEIIEHLKGQPQ